MATRVLGHVLEAALSATRARAVAVVGAHALDAELEVAGDLGPARGQAVDCEPCRLPQPSERSCVSGT
jgi:hypothetical protein